MQNYYVQLDYIEFDDSMDHTGGTTWNDKNGRSVMRISEPDGQVLQYLACKTACLSCTSRPRILIRTARRTMELKTLMRAELIISN